MASNLRVDQILPSTSTNVAIGTATGSVTLVGSVSGTSITNSGTTTVAAGSTSAPSITPTGDSNTGIFFPSADTIAFAEGGAEAARFDSSGRLGIGTINPSFLTEIYSTSTNTYADNAGVNIGPLALRTINNSATAGQTATIRLISSDNGGNQNAVSVIANIQESSGSNNAALAFQVRGSDGVVERLRINSSGNIGIGTASPSQKLEVVGGEIKAGRVDSTNEGGQVSFGRATDNATGWYLDVYGNTSTPQLRFVDVSNAAVRASIDSSGNFTLNSGNIVIGTSGKGIDFSAGANAAGMTSEVLNDYEEGTFTPTGNNITYSGAFGSYVKIGRMVMGTFNVLFPSTADGNTAEIRSLPFTVTAGSAYQSGAYPCATDSSLTESTFFTATGTRFIFRNNSNGDRSNANFSGKFVQASFVYYTDS